MNKNTANTFRFKKMILSFNKIKRLQDIKNGLLVQKPSALYFKTRLSIKKKFSNLLTEIRLNKNFSKKTKKKNILFQTRAKNTLSSSKTEKKNKLLLKKLKPIDLANKLLCDLNLEFENIGDTAHNKYLKHLLNSEEILYNKIYEILNDSTTTLEEKQTQLELLTLKSHDYEIGNKFLVPANIEILIKKIDNYLSEKNLNKLDSFLPYKIVKNLSKNLHINKKEQLTKEKKMAISQLILGLKLFLYQKKSFGLFLYSTLILISRDKSPQKDLDKNSQKIFFDFKTNDYFIKRTALISILSHQFIEFVKASKPNVERNLFKKAAEEIPMKKFQDIKKKIDLVKSSFSLSLEEKELFYFLVQDSKLQDLLYTKTKDTDVIKSEIGIILLVFIEAIGLIDDDSGTRKILKARGIRTPGLVKIPEKYISSIFEVPFTPYNLPLIAKPKFWKIDKSNPQKNFGYGGFFYNSTLNISKQNTENAYETALVTSLDIESINYVQSNFYKINKNYLKLITRYPKFFIETFLENFPERSKLSRRNKKTGRITIADISTYLNADLNYKALKADLPAQTKNESILIKLEKQKEKIQSEYIAIIERLVEFIHIYCIADLFKDVTFFFAIIMGEQGKFYDSSTGNGFGLQADRLCQNLIELQGNCYDKTINLPCINKNENEPCYLDIPEDVLCSHKQTDFYAELKSLCNIKNSCLKINMNKLGLSILFGLVGFEEGLKLTNIIQNVNPKEIHEKNGIYLFVSRMFQRVIQKHSNFMFDEMFSGKFIKKQAKLFELSEQDIKNKLLCIYYGINWGVLAAGCISEIVMWQDYTQINTRTEKVNYIHNFFVQPLVTLNTSAKITPKDQEFLKNTSYAIAHWVDKYYYKLCFPMLKKFYSIIRTEVNHEKPLLLTIDKTKTTQFEVRPLKRKALKSFKSSFKKTDTVKINKHKINYFTLTNEIDKKKASKTTVANFISFLKSRLCLLLVYKCMQKEILLWTDHNCLYTTHENSLIVKELFFESFKEIILENNTLENFFDANKTRNTKKLNKYLSDTNTAKKKILEKINTNKLKMSKHILCDLF